MFGRVGFQNAFSRFDYFQRRSQRELNLELQKFDLGTQIVNGWEDTVKYNDTLQLDFETSLLSRSISVAQHGRTWADTSDQKLRQVSQLMDEFKDSLIAAANDGVNSDTTRATISSKLKALRKAVLDTMNSELGGKSLFAGSEITRRAFSIDGQYKGNREDLTALIGDSTQVPYNVNGYDAMKNQDVDYYRVISTNVKHYNMTKLHPEIMDEVNKSAVPKKEFLKSTDAIRDLVGDDDDDPSNNGNEFFYIRGRRSDGTTFKDKFSLSASYVDKDHTSKVSDLLERIGRSFGNTTARKVVDVKLNEWGQIEVSDLTRGSSAISFHMVSSNEDVDDINKLGEMGARVTTYTKAPFAGARVASLTNSVQDNYDHRVHTFPNTFRDEDNNLANDRTKLGDVFGVSDCRIALGGSYGNHADGSAGGALDSTALPTLPAGTTWDPGTKTYFVPVLATNTFSDLKDILKKVYNKGDTNVVPELDSAGKLTLIDKNVKKLRTDLTDPPFDGPSSLHSKMQFFETATATPINTLSNDYEVEYDKAYFHVHGSSMTGNTKQIVRSTNELAKDSDTLESVAGASLVGHDYSMDVVDFSGHKYSVNLEFGPTVKFNFTDEHGNRVPATGGIELYNANHEPTTPKEFTYKQLTEVINVMTNYGNVKATGIALGSGTTNAQNAEIWRQAVTKAQEEVGVKINEDGYIDIRDKTGKATKIRFAMYDKKSSDFTSTGANNAGIVLNAAQAIVVDDPRVDFFDIANRIIEAVDHDVFRADGQPDKVYSRLMENPGMENLIKRFDHMKEHFERSITRIGSRSRQLSTHVEKTQLVQTHIKELRSDTIDADMAEAYQNLTSKSMHYQSMLSAISKVMRLSLADYLR